VRITSYIDDLLDDLETLKPRCLTDICRFVKNHPTFMPITMFARNLDQSGLYLYDMSICLLQAIRLKSDPRTIDIQLAALLYLVGEVYGSRQDRKRDPLLSSASKETSQYHWSRAMASSILLQEVASEKIRQSA
jgi:hypothetical protein